MQSLVAAVASFRFQAGELAFLFSFLAFLLPGHGSSFLRRAFSFCLNRCLRRSGRKRAAVSLLDDRFAADGHGGAGARVGGGHGLGNYPQKTRGKAHRFPESLVTR